MDLDWIYNNILIIHAINVHPEYLSVFYPEDSGMLTWKEVYINNLEERTFITLLTQQLTNMPDSRIIWCRE